MPVISTLLLATSEGGTSRQLLENISNTIRTEFTSATILSGKSRRVTFPSRAISSNSGAESAVESAVERGCSRLLCRGWMIVNEYADARLGMYVDTAYAV